MSTDAGESAHRVVTRLEELEEVVRRLAPYIDGRDFLEIGAGDGTQLMEFAKRCRSAHGIDIDDWAYAGPRRTAITAFDGHRIPFPDESFDVVYSSNVLEHIPHLDEMQGEIARVLRPGGVAIHVLPTQHWRLWSSLTHYPTMLRPNRRPAGPFRSFRAVARLIANTLIEPRHGVRGNRITEYFFFRPSWWSRRFREAGWVELLNCPVGILYSGHRLLGARLTMSARKRLARLLGSSTHLFALRKAPP